MLIEPQIYGGCQVAGATLGDNFSWQLSQAYEHVHVPLTGSPSADALDEQRKAGCMCVLLWFHCHKKLYPSVVGELRRILEILKQ